MTFESDGYIFVKNLADKELCKIAERYALYQRDEKYNECAQVPGSHANFGADLMDEFLSNFQPMIEEYTGLKLVPVNSYYRVYEPGNVLYDHTDRPDCEISLTLTLGFKYVNKPDDYRWPIHLYIGEEKKFFHCEVGDALIYKGHTIKHGRERFETGDNSHHVNVFLHYMDVDNILAK